MYTVLIMEKPNGHKKNETIVLDSEPLIFKKGALLIEDLETNFGKQA